jgi:hypothetical protein
MIFACYRLNDNKFMSDGTEIPNDKNLYCIKNEEDILFLLFEDEKKNSILFWTRLEEVFYICDMEKEFDLNIDDIINGEYFNLI